MKIGIAVRKDATDYFVHQSYIYMLKKYGYQFDFITQETDLSSFDGFLLPGGYDLDPRLYHETNYASQHIDEEMDKLDFRILKYAEKTKKPLLGICRGIQSINVYFGGTLKQDMRNHMDENHIIYFNNTYILVNSFHHQSIARLAPKLLVLGTSLDHEIEIIKHQDFPIYGVQFHPELFHFDISVFFNAP